MSLFINSLSPNTSEDGKSRDVESERSINHTVDQVRIEISKLRSQSLFETLNGAVNWDNEYSTQATEREKEAHAILQRLKLDYLLARSQDQEGPCLHHTTSNFLANRHAMEDTPLLNIFKKMPKAGDLHVHFNACLPAHILLDIAANMEQMYITSDRALVHSEDFENCEIQFQILSQEKALENPGNLFDSDYRRDERQTMKLNSFIQLFPSYQVELQASQWLQKKLIFGVDELYDSQDEAWKIFNVRTRMMKGLFNYKTAFRTYTRLFLEYLVDQRIQYAEIRPNFMNTNQLWSDNGMERLNNEHIMTILIREYEKFQKDTDNALSGLKVIYCTPRSFEKGQVQLSLNECLAFKIRWPEWIAGFDLVGEESKGHPLDYFLEEFICFRMDCERQGVEIPFLFHCGESREDSEGNLAVALVLQSKRIGHGYALTQYPQILREMVKQNVCVETCPISNEILGLNGEHPLLILLRNGMHCTVNTDNATLFGSSLAHDFFQTFVSTDGMTLYGIRQMISWAFEHACMSEKERCVATRKLEKSWCDFIAWVVAEYDC